MVGVNLVNFSKFKGHLLTLDKKQAVEVKEIIFDTDSLKNIAAVMQSDTVRKENQKIFVKSITISKDQMDAFTQGQHLLKKIEEGHLVATTQSRSPRHFYANFEGNAIKNERGIKCTFELGSISFDLTNALFETSSDYVTYQNVDATLYRSEEPYSCTYEFIDTEDDESI